MRLFNFAIVAGTKEVTALESTLPTRNLVVSGVIGQDNLDLDKKQNGAFLSFATHFGNDTSESPYGNTKLYNVSRVNTDVETSLSQSFSAEITGSAKADFIFIIETNNRGF
ncbi:MAG TPA: hypothetical protein EYQ00_12335 [Dehalococcoidia bacterium]|nr:hypothetical protein [Dehalococcoidia bacterium]